MKKRTQQRFVHEQPLIFGAVCQTCGWWLPPGPYFRRRLWHHPHACTVYVTFAGVTASEPHPFTTRPPGPGDFLMYDFE